MRQIQMELNIAEAALLELEGKAHKLQQTMQMVRERLQEPECLTKAVVVQHVIALKRLRS